MSIKHPSFYKEHFEMVPIEKIYDPIILNIDAELLMKDILKNGLNQPLQVTKMGDLYRVLDGNHRLVALKRLGWTKIPCMVLDGEWQ